MKNGANIASDALQSEIKQLNASSNNVYEGAKNYFDIALKNVEATSMQTAEVFTLSTDETLKAKLKTQIITRANYNDNFLKEILKKLKI